MGLRRSVLSLLNGVVYPYRLNFLARNVANELTALSTISQQQLVFRYQELRDSGRPLWRVRDAGFRVYSEADEDGILLYLFAVLGFGERRCIDLGASPGSQSNTANLILHHGFRALLIDGSRSAVEFGRSYYAGYPDTSVFPPTIVAAFVSPENIDAIITQHGFHGEIDALSIDIDGLDYWVWQAITCVNPRLVVAEINRWWPADRAVTVPNTSDFVMPRTDPPYLYHGASLGALVKLARTKGYRLVACNNRGYNVFFLRDGEGEREFPEITPEVCLPAELFGEQWRTHDLPKLQQYEWIEV